MLQKTSLMIFLVLCAAGIKAAPEDSLLRLSELIFKNETEREAFVDFQKQGHTTATIQNLLMNTYSGYSPVNRARAAEQVNESVAYLEKETAGLTDEKKVKSIYKYIHKRFLSVYKLQNSFSDIFEKGEYNCVSASALYALVFSKMNIPFTVMEAPQHVYLVAFPNTHKILIESTSPTNGYFIFKDTYVQRFVRHLYEAKLISETDYRNSTAEALFNRHYFDKNGLHFEDLAGVQYCNYSAYFSENNDNEKALEEVKKACYLWPGEKTRYLLQGWLLFMAGNSDYKREEDVKRLALLCRFNNLNDREVSDERIKNEFLRVMKAQLIGSSDYAMMERSFDQVQGALRDTLLKNEIAFAYHYELARLGYLNFKNKEYVMSHLKSAYRVNPQHADLRTIIKGYFLRLIDKSGEPSFITKQMEEFTLAFDFLKSESDFNSIRANCLLELAYQSFVMNLVSKGEKQLQEFEALCGGDSGIKPAERFVERAYASVASYYYKKGNLAKTREYLKRGISFAPECFGLHQRLSQAR